MKTNQESSLKVLQEVLPILKEHNDYSNASLYELLSIYIKENNFKVGFVMWPLRVALSGKMSTPAGATEIMEILGKDESIRRIEIAIEKLL